MQESLIHYLWSLQYFDKKDLRTTQDELVEIFHPGTLNTDSGPDFSNARLRIGSMSWVGNVEIHTESSAWLDHKHETDPAYDTVILHVVWHDDKPISRRDGTLLPTIELRGRVSDDLIRNYRQLISSSFSIPCQKSFPDVEPVVKLDMVEKALVQRLERKAAEVQTLLELNGNSWVETTWQLIARAFGFKINADPCFQLAKSIPLKLLHKQNQQMQTEALLFGQAGFLEASKGDEYYKKLQKEYQLLSHKYSTAEERMSKSQWRFLRLRPSNFPSLRLAQLTALVHQRRTLFSGLLDAGSVNELVSFFSVTLSPYWNEHYQFTKKSGSRGHELGRGSIEVIIVNTVIPLLAAYARHADDSVYMERALALLEQLPAEENSITRTWADLGMKPGNSFEAQGLIELFNTFCQRKNCLNCAIGAKVIRPPDHEPRTSVS